MSTETQKLLNHVLALPSAEPVALVEKLLISLECLDPELDALWAKEAEDRLAAYRAGEMPSFTLEETFAENAD